MSRALRLTIMKTKIKNILSKAKIKIEHIPDTGFDAIPSVADLRIPSITEISPTISYPMAIDKPFHHFEKPNVATKRPMLTAGKTLRDAQDDLTSDLHLEIAEVLKESGYSIKEVKALSSGEKVITISDVLAASNQKLSYEFAYRKRQ